MTAQPLALVYRGPASRPAGCSEAVAEVLARNRHGFDVRFVGPREGLSLRDDVLAAATLYAQPGGGTLRHGYRVMKKHRERIRSYVRAGGNYLGFCLGGYLAGATPGFALLPGDTDQYIATPGATVTTSGDTIVDVQWGHRTRGVFFQDGPVFQLTYPSGDDGGHRGVTILARYPNRQIAALVTDFGAGRVGVVGPHPEAPPEWYADAGVAWPGSTAMDLADDLIEQLLNRRVTGGNG
ncbi:glutamine amidotransferase-like uncharacterized protein [Prauserella isguenensis]|uniref:Glutamine amidotransferase-like uncharacterized protein n=1 Tax=Prauserella isguenensis TaxID=1470180 RepID=A0A839RW46_9PSEU|nr:BPL-N domain-containing protein [Prauserella isguenensis]MBB3049060.1 glutamine amidotransferase-like uncharacterized protein [Prauserella isguenensis]